MSWWSLREHVGALPSGAAEAGGYVQASADAYTYGAASQALSEGQAMSAWADLSAKQNTPAIREISGTAQCPAGYLFVPNAGAPGVPWPPPCVGPSNVRVSSYLPTDPPSWWSELPAWFRANHPVALAGYSTSLAEAKKMLPTALLQLGYLEGAGTPSAHAGGWSNVKSACHALALAMVSNVGPTGSRDVNIEEDADEVERQLTQVAAPIYDAAIASGGKPAPTWVQNPGALWARSSSSLLLIAATLVAGAAAIHFLRPDLPHHVWSYLVRLKGKVPTP